MEVFDDGALRFRQPDGQTLPASGQPAVPVQWQALPDQNQRLGLDINAQTGITRWGGETMDYDIAIGYLMERDGVLAARFRGNVSGTSTTLLMQGS